MADGTHDKKSARPEDRRSSGSAPLPPGADPAIATQAVPLESREPDSEEFISLAPGPRDEADEDED